MSMQDLISDSITRLRNAQMASHAFAEILASKLNINILDIFQQEGYIDAYKKSEDLRSIKVALKYYRGMPVISKITRISKPSRRVYIKAKQIKLVRNGLGVAIISTSKGLLTDKAAREQRLGGELLLTIE
jgi:small subunit ribosomal protein S8